jgi:cytochrome c
MKYLTLAAAMALLSAPAFAQELTGDAAAGEEQFGRQCVACHVVVNEAGETLAGRNARVGPNLYQMPGNVMAHVEGFDYSDAFVELRERGDVWTEELFVAYVQDPTAFLREQTENRRARGKMAFQVRDAQQAADIYAYLSSIAPAPEAEAASE